MKIIFAADTSFHYFGNQYPGDDAAVSAMSEVSARMKEADFSVINLETTFGRPEKFEPIKKSGPNQISLPEFTKYIEVLSPSAASLANNHTGDFGAQPIFDTQKILRDMGILPFGAGANIAEAYLPAILEKDGQKVALIGVCENEFGIATEKSAGSAGFSLGRVTEAIRRAKEEGCLPIIFFHGGNEHNAFPSPKKKELYRHFVDLGAASVIAMHTHCPQGYEIYRGAPIVYSMGNFYFPAPNYAHGPRFAVWAQGYMSELTIENGKIKLAIIPYKQSFDGVTLQKGEELAHFEKYMEAICRPIQDDLLLGKYFDAWCMKVKYLSGLSKYDPTQGTATSGIKNLLSCEAHNEVVQNEARIRFEGDPVEASALIADLTELQEMKIPSSLFA